MGQGPAARVGPWPDLSHLYPARRFGTRPAGGRPEFGARAVEVRTKGHRRRGPKTAAAHVNRQWAGRESTGSAAPSGPVADAISAARVVNFDLGRPRMRPRSTSAASIVVQSLFPSTRGTREVIKSYTWVADVCGADSLSAARSSSSCVTVSWAQSLFVPMTPRAPRLIQPVT